MTPAPRPSPELPAGLVERLGPVAPVTPLVVAVPHAGRRYPPDLLDHSAVARSVLEQLEDRHADLLAERLIADGAVAIVARVARAFIDLNRGEEDLDPVLREHPDAAPGSARAATGLGLIPRRLGRRDLWRTPPTPAEAAARIARLHRPYHAAIAAALEAARARFGHAVLIDCHSMPPLRGSAPARIVIGDRHGSTAASGLAARLVGRLRRDGIAAALNVPYAGAHTIARHGDPQRGIHAIQLELDRALYLRPDLRTPAPTLPQVQALVGRIGAWALELAAQSEAGTLDAIAAE